MITGVSWTLFIAANMFHEPALWYISVVVNSLQGALIGLIFLLRSTVRNLWREKLDRVRMRCRCYTCRCRCCVYLNY